MTVRPPRRVIFLGAVTAALLLPLLTSLASRPADEKRPLADTSCRIGTWSSSRIPMTEEVLKNYAPLDVAVAWRRYRSAGRPFIDGLIQVAGNHENLHDSYACLVFAGAQPRRLRIITLPGPLSPSATLFECRLNDRPYYTLFCYQSKAGSAPFPAQALSEQLHLCLVARLPCRLVELTTPVSNDPEAALDRLKELAAGICNRPL